MNCPPEVIRLVERFDREQDSYRSGRYNETQVRREFIDPTFKALGWDVDNEQGYAEAYKDVVHEDAIKVGGATKAPDYCFRVGGTRKFFLEAKKPSVKVKDDIAAAFQLRRYAWSAKLSLSIVTDFEEFAAYDCRVKPEKLDKSSTARILYVPFDQYPGRWEEIAGVFSREAILKGSFDRFAESTKGKKGTAEVDAAFLKEIEEWRSTLAHTIALRNPSLTTRELNFAVQVTIDRLIFLRICEDRGIEDYGELQSLCNGANTYSRLLGLYGKADHRYNSGLFHFERERGRSEAPDTLTPSLTIDDKALKEILKRLYYPDSPYEFSVLPADILGQVYEQFLGKVIRLTPGHRAVVEDKPEVKKAGGVYYTPTYVVDYIVKNTVRKLLEGSTPKKASSLRILDPACGSGSFLIGAFQYLIDWHRDWYVEDGPQKHTKELFLGPGSEWRLTTAEKKRILLNNICGVDIDSQAVETTKLSLLLKVLEGETQETINAQLSFLRERALPDLANNIKCGNSLIGSDFYDDHQLGLLLDEEERYRLNAFDWQEQFPSVLAGGGDRGRVGFDVVIGNPPYIRIHRVQHEESDYFFSHYTTPSSKTDVSQVFLEKALALVAPRGLIGFICTSQWMSTEYGRRMRTLVSNGQLQEIVDFGSLPVFPRASTYPAIFLLSPEKVPAVRYRKVSSSRDLSVAGIEAIKLQNVELASYGGDPWNLSGFDLPAFLGERAFPWASLKDLADVLIGTLTGMDSAFVLTAEKANELGLEASLLLPYAYRGAEVRSYCDCNPSAVVIYPYEEGPGGSPILITEIRLREQFPVVHEYLGRRKDALRQRRDSRRLYASGDAWYRHLRAGSFSSIAPAKLIIKGIGRQSTVGTLSSHTAFNGANCPAILLHSDFAADWVYFLGILNSSIASCFLRNICPPKLNDYSRFNATSVGMMPVVLDEDRLHLPLKNELAPLVDAMRAACERSLAARTNHEHDVHEQQRVFLRTRINETVYKIYGLTPDLIELVESSNATNGA